jgi:hypothetical protein
VYWGKGGYDFHTVYNMPVWLRLFTYKRISDQHSKENSEMERIKNRSSKSGNSSIDFANPDTSKLPSQYVNNSSSPTYGANFSKR